MLYISVVCMLTNKEGEARLSSICRFSSPWFEGHLIDQRPLVYAIFSKGVIALVKVSRSVGTIASIVTARAR